MPAMNLPVLLESFSGKVGQGKEKESIANFNVLRTLGRLFLSMDVK